MLQQYKRECSIVTAHSDVLQSPLAFSATSLAPSVTNNAASVIDNTAEQYSMATVAAFNG
eukprot:17709-Heterococcus_DN1.PRE.3